MQDTKVRAGSIIVATATLLLFNLTFANAQWDEGREASMVALIGAPEKYDGKIIVTIGIAVINENPPYTVLFLNRYDAENDVTTNAIGLKISHDQMQKFGALNGQRVYLRGRYHAGHPSDGGPANGHISEITIFKADSELSSHFKLPPER